MIKKTAPPSGVIEPKTRPVDRLMRPVHAFSEYRGVGAGLLVFAALVSLVLANSSLAESWTHLLHLDAGVTIGDWSFQKSLRHWVNDGLMAIFFFHVGLEVKRETTVGDLAEPRRAAMPSIAAAGGMLVPALIYFAINYGTNAADGWGIPMATDIAFALGVLSFVGDRVPRSLKVFLTALAIVDDIGAVIVIALFHTDTVALGSLALAFLLLGVAVLLNRLQARSLPVFFLVGFCVWLAFVESGVHATVAALLMAFTIPAKTHIHGEKLRHNVEQHLQQLLEIGAPRDRDLNSPAQQDALDRLTDTVRRAGTPLQRLEIDMAPWVTFLVLPIFALVNAGVAISGDVSELFADPVALGVMLGLVLGKPVGVCGFVWIALKLKLAELPENVALRHVAGSAFLAGIGFTMSLFIADLAFNGNSNADGAKFGILVASSVSALLGLLWLKRTPQAAQ